MLLLHGWDPLKPQTPYWFTIGGGVEAGETTAQAASRELLEEVGIRMPVEDDVGVVGTALETVACPVNR